MAARSHIPAEDISDPDEQSAPGDVPGTGKIAESAKAAAARYPDELIPVATEESVTGEPGAARAVGYDHDKGEYLSK
jgi:hypothetical protein